MTAKYVEGDHGTVIRRHIKDEKGTALDITGAISVTLRWMQGGTLQERPMVVTDANKGVVEYVIVAGDLFEPNVTFELVYMDGGGGKYTTPVFDGPHEVRKPYGSTMMRRK